VVAEQVQPLVQQEDLMEQIQHLVLYLQLKAVEQVLMDQVQQLQQILVVQEDLQEDHLLERLDQQLNLFNQETQEHMDLEMQEDKVLVVVVVVLEQVVVEVEQALLEEQLVA
tara:strand:- start:168 stop:503 length:336 start_codon:yes stop_codon:yes gene_type:complete